MTRRNVERTDSEREAADRALLPPVGGVTLRISRALADAMRADLGRPHPTALERVGFLSVTHAEAEGGELVVLGLEYHAVPDEHYVEARGAGARIGVDAIRAALERAMGDGRGVFHVHLHDHGGIPAFSQTDREEQPVLVSSFAAAVPRETHGMLVLSRDAANAWVWEPGARRPTVPRLLSVVGYPLTLLPGADLRFERRTPAPARGQRFARQSFLGADGQHRLGAVRVGIIGFGGGGSHVGLQAAHLGMTQLRVADGDRIDESNLNRLVGGTSADVRARRLKVDIARRLVRALQGDADAVMHAGRWQDRAPLFRGCDVIVGCVDTFAERRELEVLARRFLVPYIDIGMDIHEAPGEAPQMGGQVILSMPGDLCMTCLGFLTPERLTHEAQRYGAAGARPQVVWPNGILASSTVGVVVDLVTGWTGLRDRRVFLSYDGNHGTLVPHPRLAYLNDSCCPHFPMASAGPPRFRPLVARTA